MTPEELRRRYAPDRRRELVVDLREALAGTEDASARQALFDTAAELAGNLVDNGTQLKALQAELHQATFGPAPDVMGEGWRRLAVDRFPELQDVFDKIAAAESAAERSAIVLAAVSSGRFDGDADALRGLLALDPTVDQRLDEEDPTAADDAVQADIDRSVAEVAEPGESRAQAMLRQHLEAAEAAAAEAEAVPIDA
jgi:hypothetical protein